MLIHFPESLVGGFVQGGLRGKGSAEFLLVVTTQKQKGAREGRGGGGRGVW